MFMMKAMFALGACASVGVWGQEGHGAGGGSIHIRTSATEAGNAGTFRFVGAEFNNAGKTVKGAPYTAEAITETTRILSDGNRIVNKTTSKLARDSAGRTRREQSIQAMGPWASGKTETMVFINDPDTRVSYVLDPAGSMVHKNGTDMVVTHDMALAMEKKHAGERAHTTQMIHKTKSDAGPEGTTESLGTKVVEGLLAEGTRRTNTIPAGQIGNQRPIEISSETWTSPDLQMIVMSRHTDPQVGETVYRLTNIQRVQPDPALFAIPSGYKVEDEAAQLKKAAK